MKLASAFCISWAWVLLASAWLPAQATAQPRNKIKCRPANAPFNLDGPDLPVCRSSAKKRVINEELSLEDVPRARKPAANTQEKRPSPPPSEASFDSYMNANAHHPALMNNSKKTDQSAFTSRAKPAQTSAKPDPQVFVNKADPFASGSAPGSAAPSNSAPISSSAGPAPSSVNVPIPSSSDDGTSQDQ